MDGIEATKEIRRLERTANIGIFPGTPPATSPSVGGAITEKSGGSSESASSLSVPSSHHNSAHSPFKASVIIVALTASSFNSDRVAALAAGCNDFLNKPVDHKWLEKKIIEWGSMQYILLSGLFSDNRWKGNAAGINGHSSMPKPSMPRDLSHETQSSFSQIPNEQAKALADKLHIAPKKKRGSSATLSPPLPPATTNSSSGSRTSVTDQLATLGDAMSSSDGTAGRSSPPPPPPLLGQPREPKDANPGGPTVTDGAPPTPVLRSGSGSETVHEIEK